MASYRQQTAHFYLTYPLNVPDYRVYAACRQFGLVKAYRENRQYHFRVAYVDFVASDKLNELKPEHTVNIEDGVITFKFLPEKHFYYHGDEETMASTKVLMHSLNLMIRDPPPNILDTLNDDCLDEIFTKLEWCDLMTLMNVCHRFRDVAERVAGRERVINTRILHKPLWQAERYLRKFGSSVRTVRADDHHNDQMILLFLLSKYCSNVDELEIGSVDGRITYELHHLFKRVRKLHIGGATDNGRSPGSLNGILHPGSQIESLHIESSAELPPLHLPNLIEVRLKDPRDLAPFISVNQQIEKLEVLYEDFYGGAGVDLRRLTNLQELTLSLKSYSDSPDIPAFGGLSRLHTVRLIDMRSKLIKRVLNALIDGGVQIKRLILCGIWHWKQYPIDIICRMKSVEYLKMDCVSDANLLRLATNGDNIIEIDLGWSGLTLQGVVDALKSLSCLSRLKKMTVEVEHQDEICKICEIMDIANKLDAIAELRSDRNVDVEVHMLFKIAHDFEDIDDFFLLAVLPRWWLDQNRGIEVK